MNTRRSLFPAPLPAIDQATKSSPAAPRPYTILALILLALITASAWRTVDSSTLLLHLKAGQRIIDTQQIPKRDIYSAASYAQSWHYIEWGWGVILAATYKQMNWLGITLLNTTCIALTALLMLLRARRRGAKLLEALTTTALVLAALIPTFQATPERIALPLFVTALLIGESRRLRPLALLPLITFLWANLHPAFLLPAAIPFARMIFPPPDQHGNPAPGPTGYLFIIIITCIAAMFINPGSLDIMNAAWKAALYSATSGLSLSSWGATDVLLRLIPIAAFITLLATHPRTMHNWEKLLAVILLASTIISPAALSFLLIYLAAPAAVRLSALLSAPWQTPTVRHAAGTALCLAIIALATATAASARLTAGAFGTGLRKGVFPETAAGRLASLPIRNTILNTPDHGGYLIWRTWPAWNITIDQRTTLYTPEQRQQYDLLWQGAQGWETLLTQWRVQAILGTTQIATDHPEANLYHRLADSTDWTPVYWDSDSILYIHNSVQVRESNLTPFRELKPGLNWNTMSKRVTTPKQRRDLTADLRRVTLDDPTNTVAQEFLRRAEQAVNF